MPQDVFLQRHDFSNIQIKKHCFEDVKEGAEYGMPINS